MVELHYYRTGANVDDLRIFRDYQELTEWLDREFQLTQECPEQHRGFIIKRIVIKD